MCRIICGKKDMKIWVGTAEQIRQKIEEIEAHGLPELPCCTIADIKLNGDLFLWCTYARKCGAKVFCVALNSED